MKGEGLARVALAAVLASGVLTEWCPGFAATHFFEAGMLGLAAAWAWRRAFSDRPVAAGPAAWVLAAGAAWAAAQAAGGISVYRFASWRAALNWAACAAAYLLAADLFREGQVRRDWRAAAGWAGFALSVVATVQLFTSGGKVFWLFPSGYPDFVMGPFINRDHYSAFIELVLPLVLFEAAMNPRRRTAYGVMAGVMYASVVAGASRAGAVLATAEVLGAAALTWGGRKPGRVGLAVVGSAAVFTAVVGWQVLWARFQEPDPWKFRREVNVSALRMIRERPLTGFGMGGFEAAYPAYATQDSGVRVNHAHDDWAEWAAEGGLPFAGLMLGLALWSVRVSWRAPWAAGVVAVFLHSGVDYALQSASMLCWTMAVLGAAAASREGVSGGSPSVTGER